MDNWVAPNKTMLLTRFAHRKWRRYTDASRMSICF